MVQISTDGHDRIANRHAIVLVTVTAWQD